MNINPKDIEALFLQGKASVEIASIVKCTESEVSRYLSIMMDGIEYNRKENSLKQIKHIEYCLFKAIEEEQKKPNIINKRKVDELAFTYSKFLIR